MISKNLSSLIGLLLSDGSIYYDKSKRTYCIQFTSSSKQMRNYFIFICSKLFGIKNFSENICRNAISVRFFSKKVAESLFRFSPVYRTMQFPDGTYPDCRVPSEIRNSKKLSSEFLKSFASCDGSVYFNPHKSVRFVEISCFHPKLIKDIADCLKTLDINCYVQANCIRISNKSELGKFARSVGFLDESHVSDRRSAHLGISKNALLAKTLI